VSHSLQYTLWRRPQRPHGAATEIYTPFSQSLLPASFPRLCLVGVPPGPPIWPGDPETRPDPSRIVRTPLTPQVTNLTPLELTELKPFLVKAMGMMQTLEPRREEGDEEEYAGGSQ
jgi:hypothetical protein